jgi:hypothetical protein
LENEKYGQRVKQALTAEGCGYKKLKKAATGFTDKTERRKDDALKPIGGIKKTFSYMANCILFFACKLCLLRFVITIH